jgi:hypothetical protein
MACLDAHLYEIEYTSQELRIVGVDSVRCASALIQKMEFRDVILKLSSTL